MLGRCEIYYRVKWLRAIIRICLQCYVSGLALSKLALDNGLKYRLSEILARQQVMPDHSGKANKVMCDLLVLNRLPM